MPVQHDEFDEDDLDPEDPDPSDMDSFDEPGLMPCPHCRKMINEDAERCHHCGEYISEEDAPRHHSPWLIIGVIVAIILVLVVWTIRQSG